MKKIFSLVTAFVITLFILPFGLTASADGKSYDDIKDGEYNITAKALHADKDEASGAAGFINEDAVLSVQDGAFELTITIPHNDMAAITSLQIEGIEPTKDGDNWTYALADLTSELKAQVEYEVPALNMKHDVPFRFALEGLDDLPKVEVNEDTEDNSGAGEDADQDSETPEDTDGDGNGSENEGNGNEPDEPKEDEDVEQDETGITNPDQTFELEYVTDSESTKRNFNNPVTLLIKDGKKYIEMNGIGGQFIKSLTVNGEEVTWVKNNDDGTFVIQFALPGEPSDDIDLGMTIAPPGMDDMVHTVSMSFQDIKEDPKEDTEEKPGQNPDKEDPKEEPVDKPGNDQNQKPNKKPEVEDVTTPDEAHEIDYVIKHATDDEVSAADSFFQKPGILLKKDGNHYLQLTVNSWEWIQYIKHKNSDVDVVKLNEDGSAVIQFKIDSNLSDAIILDMHIIVPKEIAGMDYDMKHTARLFLDTNSMEVVDASDYEVAVNKGNGNNNSDNDKDDNVQGSGIDHKTPTKPTFGPNGEIIDNSTTPIKGNKTTNPKTGDTTNALGLSLLLIGSLVPLAIKARRRLV